MISASSSWPLLSYPHCASVSSVAFTILELLLRGQGRQGDNVLLEVLGGSDVNGEAAGGVVPIARICLLWGGMGYTVVQSSMQIVM